MANQTDRIEALQVLKTETWNRAMNCSIPDERAQLFRKYNDLADEWDEIVDFGFEPPEPLEPDANDFEEDYQRYLEAGYEY